MLLFAADAGQAPGADVFVQYGALGAIALILLWFAKSAIDRERDRADRMEEEVRRLNQLTQDKTVPALEAATRAVAETAELLRDISRRGS